MIILSDYKIVDRNGFSYVISQEPRLCPHCGCPTKVRDSKRRQLILAEGEIRTFQLRRLKCINCGTLHLEIPDLIIPHKHYSKDVIELAVHGGSSHCPAENSTIYRWNRERNASKT